MSNDETRVDRAHRHRLAARAYRLRQRGQVRCLHCGRRRAAWLLVDGEGHVLHTRELVQCGKCWQRALRATRSRP